MEDPEVSLAVVVKLEVILVTVVVVIQAVCVAGDARWRATPEVLPKAVSQSGRLSQEQHLVLQPRLLLSCLCTSVLNRLL